MQNEKVTVEMKLTDALLVVGALELLSLRHPDDEALRFAASCFASSVYAAEKRASLEAQSG